MKLLSAEHAYQVSGIENCGNGVAWDLISVVFVVGSKPSEVY
jgi:hypothetical protein